MAADGSGIGVSKKFQGALGIFQSLRPQGWKNYAGSNRRARDFYRELFIHRIGRSLPKANNPREWATPASSSERVRAITRSVFFHVQMN